MCACMQSKSSMYVRTHACVNSVPAHTRGGLSGLPCPFMVEHACYHQCASFTIVLIYKSVQGSAPNVSLSRCSGSGWSGCSTGQESRGYIVWFGRKPFIAIVYVVLKFVRLLFSQVFSTWFSIVYVHASCVCWDIPRVIQTTLLHTIYLCVKWGGNRGDARLNTTLLRAEREKKAKI